MQDATNLASGALNGVGGLGERLVAHEMALVVVQLELRQHCLTAARRSTSVAATEATYPAEILI